MKNVWLITGLLTILLIGASPFGIERLVDLTVVNKSGLPVEIKLTGSDEENYYYLKVPRGYRDAPTEKVFTVVPDTYSAVSYYIEPWDPVYGYDCSSRSSTLAATKNIRVTIMECDRASRHGGETSIVKFGMRTGRR